MELKGGYGSLFYWLVARNIGKTVVSLQLAA